VGSPKPGAGEEVAGEEAGGRLDRGRGGWGGGTGRPKRQPHSAPLVHRHAREEKATQPQIPKTTNFGGGGVGSPKPQLPIPLPSRRPRNLLGAHEDGRPHADPRAPGAQGAPANSMCSVPHSPLLRIAFWHTQWNRWGWRFRMRMARVRTASSCIYTGRSAWGQRPHGPPGPQNNQFGHPVLP